MSSVNQWIQGDGGPVIVLQASAALHWQGAEDFEHSLMNGGEVETDYDVICRCDDGVSVINRYGRDMLVLVDSEWPACFARSNGSRIVIVQSFGHDGSLDELVERLSQRPVSGTFPFEIADASLRLLVGGDRGDGAPYGFAEIGCEPGPRMCDAYCSDEAQMAVLRPRSNRG